MNTDQAKTLSDNALTKLMQALEGGQSETLKSYLAVMSRFHRYSWNNALLIYMQRPNATHVAGSKPGCVCGAMSAKVRKALRFAPL
jgi:hypothetical protein